MWCDLSANSLFDDANIQSALDCSVHGVLKRKRIRIPIKQKWCQWNIMPFKTTFKLFIGKNYLWLELDRKDKQMKWDQGSMNEEILRAHVFLPANHFRNSPEPVFSSIPHHYKKYIDRCQALFWRKYEKIIQWWT